MKIERVLIRHLRVPLKRPFRTAGLERTASDSVVVELVLEDASSGFGEGVPREYVTGETPTGCIDFLRDAAARLIGAECTGFAETVELAAELPFGDDPLRPRCAARCALELALLDAAGRRVDVSLAKLVAYLPDVASIAQARDEVRYGVVLPVDTGSLKAMLYRLYGFQDAKLKVGTDPERDLAFVTRMRKRLGPRVDLRVDANGGWSSREAPKIMRKLRRLDVSFVEQPIAKGDPVELARVRRDGQLPVMIDESLVSERDAQLAVDAKLADAFNLRLSKNGGLIPLLHLAKLAQDNRIGVQLGCHPGETGILSAAGRAVACSVRNLLYLEGSYDRHVLRRNVIREDVTFGRGGRAPGLSAPGLGVTVVPEKLDALTVETVEVP